MFPRKRKFEHMMYLHNERQLMVPQVWQPHSLPAPDTGSNPTADSLIAPANSVDCRNVNNFPLLNSMISVSHACLIKCTEARTDTEYVFVRQESLDYYNFINGVSPGRFGYSRGPPGVGKTLMLILMLFYNMLQNGNDGDVAVIYKIVSQRTVVIYRHSGQCYIGEMSLTKNVEDVFSPNKGYNLRYVLLDGATDENVERLCQHLERLTRRSRHSRIFCTSDMFLKIPGNVIRPRGSTYYVELWKIETYEVMISDDFFFNVVKENLISDAAKAALDSVVPIDQPPNNWTDLLASHANWTTAMRNYILQDKFLIGGHSARWMFSRTYEEAIINIEDYIDRVEDVSNLVNGFVGGSASVSVNHLRCKFLTATAQYSSTFTSDLCGRSLTSICNTEIIRSFNNYCLHQGVVNIYPTLDGIVVVLDVINYLKLGNLDSRTQIYTAAVDDTPARYISVNNRYNVATVDVYTFTSAATWSGPDSPLKLPTTGLAYYPTVFNNGGFDFVVVKRDSANCVTAEFVQVTRAKHHDLRIFFMHAFINAFNCNNVAHVDHITSVRITIMCPREKLVSFRKPTYAQVIGDLSAHHWNLGDLEICSFQRTTDFNI